MANTAIKDTTESGNTASTIFTSGTNSSPITSSADDINAMYEQLIDASKTNIQGSVDLGVSQYQADLERALPSYQKQRNQSAVDTAKNEQTIKEYAMYTGDRGGMSRQDILQNVTAGQNVLSEINLQEQQLRDTTQRAISDLITQGELNKALSEAEYGAQRISALIDDKNRVEESQAQWTQWLAEMSGNLPGGGRTLAGQQFDLDKLYTEAQIASMNASTAGTNAYNSEVYGIGASGTTGTTGTTGDYSDAPFAANNSTGWTDALSSNAQGLLYRLEQNIGSDMGSSDEATRRAAQQTAYKSISYYIDYLSDSDVDYLLNHFGISV